MHFIQSYKRTIQMSLFVVAIMAINHSFANHPPKFTFFSQFGVLLQEELNAACHLEDNLIQKRGKFNDPIVNVEEYRLKTIVIDAGHGGHDPGCTGSSSKEKHIVLAISKRLATMMRAKYPNLNVILTRDKDVFIPLHKRADIANKHNADLFISLHCNAAPGKASSAYGTETYVMGLHTSDYNLNVAKRENSAILYETDYQNNYDYDPNSPEGHIALSLVQNAFLEQSILFAENVERQFEAQARKSRGVKQAGFVVLKRTTMPSVLIEAGFLTNPGEERFLYTAEGQQKIAQSILNAFTNYKLVMEGQKAYQPIAASNKISNSTPKATQKKQPYSSGVATNNNQPKSAFKWSKTPTPQTYAQKEQSTYASPTTRTTSVLKSKAPSKSTTTLASKKDISFKVQLAALPIPANVKKPEWQNIEYMVEVIREENLYKYQARGFESYYQAEQAKTKLQYQGFPTAFVIAYQNGKKVPLGAAKRALGIPSDE